ncbi:hypothetical protein RHGRI_003790 [Rhododendron griersonianum]|uniref:F-box/kelch-repeat protein n=1 Tax=Rhododendron griersonianum TaxID=479676 RepID=A0AAV6L7G9_9ERIC|nr:hypothetical protein RHGRI_003790 [Rhododendron griersonianum]
MNEKADTAVELDCPLKGAYSTIWIVGCCYGLVCIAAGNEVSIWNPSTRKSKRLPYVKMENLYRGMYGFGYDESSDDYKVVGSFNDVGNSGFDAEVKVYSLRTNSWRRIGGFPDRLPLTPHGSGTCVSGALHWFSTGGCRRIIVSLDLVKETYGEVSEPDYRDGISHQHSDTAVDLDYPLEAPHCKVRIYGLCNGLVCIGTERIVFLWNPCTRKSKRLPAVERGARFIMYAFGYVESIDDYMVVGFFCNVGTCGFNVEVMMYTLKTDSWRSIVEFSNCLPPFGSGICVNGVLHWTANGESHKVIVSLDLVKETFGESCSLYSILNEDSDTAVELDCPLKVPHRTVRLVGCCNGLVCIATERGVYIWNLSTRKSKTLPNFGMMYLCISGLGLGYDESIDDYKLVGVFCRGVYDDGYQVAVCTLRTHSWRRIGGFPHRLALGGLVTYFNGALHWTAHRGSNRIIVSLVLTKETYGELDSLVKGPDCGERIVGCCDGLVCIVSKREVRIWNPSTRKAKRFPNVETQNLYVGWYVRYGFGYAESIDDYKVVGFFRDVNSMGIEFEAQVCTLRTHSWRRIGSFPLCLPSDGLVTNLNGIFVSGALHWFSGGNCGRIIVSLDLVKETCGEVLEPHYQRGSLDKIWLDVLNGCLCTLATYDDCTDVWVMKEYGIRESWAKLVTITYAAHPFDGQCSQPLCILANGEILLHIQSQLVLYNCKDGTFSYPMIHIFSSFSVHTYVESLVSPDTDADSGV